MKKWTAAFAAAVLVAVAAIAGVASGGESPQTTPAAHNHAALAAQAAKADELRVGLNRLFGEHVYLAIFATQRGLQGGKEFPALGKALDRNSVEIANAIGSVYGTKARNEFLNGKFMWRAHIKFFVDYTVAKAKNNRAGQTRAVNNLKVYIGTFSKFLATATGLPQSALQKSITTHVMQLKGQLDAYAAGNSARSYTLTRQAYHHMGMTADVLSTAIVKKFPQKFS